MTLGAEPVPVSGPGNVSVIHFDVLDPAIVPGTGTPEPGGEVGRQDSHHHARRSGVCG